MSALYDTITTFNQQITSTIPFLSKKNPIDWNTLIYVISYPSVKAHIEDTKIQLLKYITHQKKGQCPEGTPVRSLLDVINWLQELNKSTNKVLSSLNKLPEDMQLKSLSTSLDVSPCNKVIIEKFTTYFNSITEALKSEMKQKAAIDDEKDTVTYLD